MRVLRTMAVVGSLLTAGAAHADVSACTNVLSKNGIPIRACYASKDACVMAVHDKAYLPWVQAERACYPSTQRSAYGNVCTDYLKVRNTKAPVCYPTKNDCINAVAAVYKKNYGDAAKLCYRKPE